MQFKDQTEEARMPDGIAPFTSWASKMSYADSECHDQSAKNQKKGGEYLKRKDTSGRYFSVKDIQRGKVFQRFQITIRK